LTQQLNALTQAGGDFWLDTSSIQQFMTSVQDAEQMESIAPMLARIANVTDETFDSMLQSAKAGNIAPIVTSIFEGIESVDPAMMDQYGVALEQLFGDAFDKETIQQIAAGGAQAFIDDFQAGLAAQADSMEGYAEVTNAAAE
jgi:uncharacterized protein (DUF885 family)